MQEINEFGAWNNTVLIDLAEKTSEEMFKVAKRNLELSPKEFKIASIYILETLNVMFAEERLVKGLQLHKSKIRKEKEMSGADISEKLFIEEYNRAIGKWRERYPDTQITSMCNRWLYLQGEGDKYKNALEMDDIQIEPLDRIPLICFEKNKAVEEMTEYLNKTGYDVVKRKPEIAPCPVCGTEAYSWCEEDEWYYVQCGNITCAIRSDSDISEEHVINRWNALPRKGE